MRAGEAQRGDGGGANQPHHHAEVSIEERDGTNGLIAAYRDVGSYRGAAASCGTTHKTVKGIIELHEAGGVLVEKPQRTRN